MSACDFVPDACSAALIQTCLLAKQCDLLGALGEINGVEETFGELGPKLGNLRIDLDDSIECLKDALTRAAEDAGCPTPGFPQPPEAPTFAQCLTAVADLKGQMTGDLLGFLPGNIKVTLDGNLKPTRIVVE